MRIGKLLFKEEVSSGKDIFANAEVMTPAEFVKNYGKKVCQSL